MISQTVRQVNPLVNLTLIVHGGLLSQAEVHKGPRLCSQPCPSGNASGLVPDHERRSRRKRPPAHVWQGMETKVHSWRINAAMGWVGEFRAWGGTDTQLHYLTQK